MVTGDHKLTARAIANELELGVKDDTILTGKEMDQISDEKLNKIIRNVRIFARVNPEHKFRIVKAWQKQNFVVAMTGAGVNDAPALKAADIGIALNSGTDVAKETADMILLNNNFKNIITAIRQGRIIFENIQKVIVYLLSDSFNEVFLIASALVFQLPLPILPAQILWINLINDSAPALAMTVEPGDTEVMAEKPRNKNESIINNRLIYFIFINTISINIILLILYLYLWKSGYSLEYIRTVLFSTLAFKSLFYIFSVRSFRHSIVHKNFFSNPYIFASVIIGILLQLLAVYQPSFQKIFHTQSLGYVDWGLILITSLIILLIVEINKIAVFRFFKKKTFQS